MSTGTAEPIATGSDTVALDGDDLTSLFVKGEFQGDEPTEEEEVGTPDAEAEEVETAPETVEEQEPETPDAVGDFLSGLDDEQAKDLASRLGGRLGGEIGKMRSELRELQAERTTEAEKRSPFEKKDKTPNPYESETDLKSLEETYDTATAVLKDGEKILRRYRNADPDDEVEYGDRTLTILQIEEMVENARDARDNHIPERVRQLRESEGLESQRVQIFEEVKKLHPWLGEDGELKTAFENVRDRYLPAVRDNIPDILPYFDTMLADHFAAVQHRQTSPEKKPATKTAEKRTAKKPPGSPGGSAAASARPVPSAEKRSKMLESFTATGDSMSGDDLTQFLTR
jgi:hypothetical protein